MTASGYEPPSAEQLADDLRWATKGPLENYFKKSEHSVKCSNLANLISHLHPEEWERDANWALRTVVRLAIKEKIAEGGPEGSALSWVEIGEYLCSFRHNEVPRKSNGERPGYDEYREAVYELSGLSDMHPRTFGKNVTRPFREHLAKALLELTPEDFPVRSTTSLAPRQEEPKSKVPEVTSSIKEIDDSLALAEPPGFVPRPALKQELESALEGGKRIIQLTGLWGSGKTHFADLVARSRTTTPSGMAWLSVGLHSLSASIVEELENRGVSTHGMSDALLQRHFRELLVDANAPEVVVFDDVPSYQLIEKAIPERPNSLILITCRKVLWFDDNDLKGTIRVRGMRESEAKDLLRAYCSVAVNPREPVDQEGNSNISTVNGEDWPGMLVDRLGCNPRAVEHSARQLAALPGTPVRHLAEECWNNVLNVVDGASSGNSLGDSIRGMLEDLSDNPPALRMLELLSVGLECNRKYFSIYLANYLGLISGSAHVFSGIATRAFQTLDRHNIAWVGRVVRREQVQLDYLVRDSARLVLSEEAKEAAALSAVDTSLRFLHHAVIFTVEKFPEKSEEDVLCGLINTAPFRSFFDIAWVGYVEEVDDYSIGAFIRYTLKMLHQRREENPRYRGIEGMLQKGGI
ncbi:NB-ARC domain-containing protein [Streptomyces sp. NBC_00996]|uniref:NB-ARC domain-containing protein n=1 Tax=Streptomyces sp. NBC_00996 TaxID=2903710 RepID=UPI00386C3DDB|nr:ATP-binding protein [Streptomyces sp. NBC_00996]